MGTMPDILKLADDIAQKSGLVLGKDGRGGSGTCVRLDNGDLALLTAKHVVVDCLLTGELSIARSSDKCTDLPKRIRMDSTQMGDAAYVVLRRQDGKAPAIPFSQWTQNTQKLGTGAFGLASGFPGELRKPINKICQALCALRRLFGATVKQAIIPRHMFFQTAISRTSSDLVVCSIDERIKGFPTTLRGMSGGSLFTLDGDFVGVLIEERRKLTPVSGELDVLLPGAFTELYTPFQPPPGSPTDYWGQQAWSPVFNIVHMNDKKRKAKIQVSAELFWSEKSRASQYGRMGRISFFTFIIPGFKQQYPVNTEALFYWDEDTEAAKLKALHEAIVFLLLRSEWGIDTPAT